MKKAKKRGSDRVRRPAPSATPSVRKSSGNVFADLGLSNPQDLLAKAELAHEICDLIAARELTQTKAAQVMGLDQPKISALMRGKLQGFSVERLFRCLNDLGRQIVITVAPARRPGQRGDIQVVRRAVI
jgi:predicted XRE-type DNA-binding protein